MELNLVLNSSMIGKYYEYQCDRFLVCEAVRLDNINSDDWRTQKENKESAFSIAGQIWEAHILQNLEKDGNSVVVNLKDNKFSKAGKVWKLDSLINKEYQQTFEGTVDVLQNLSNITKSKTIYLYQACLNATDSFRKKYLSSFDEYKTKVGFSEKGMNPDLIKAEYIPEKDKYCLTIIDIKNARSLKLGVEIQIAIYAELLRFLLKDEGIKKCEVNTEGIAWNRDNITNNRREHIFKLEDALKELSKFFKKCLTNICETLESCKSVKEIKEGLDYRISQKCEYCKSFNACKDYCKNQRSVRLMPYITIEAQDRLMKLIEKKVINSDSIEDVRAYLKNNEGNELTKNSSYWNRINNNRDAYFNGLISFYNEDNKKFVKKGEFSSLPISQNFSLFLTAQQDPCSGRMFAYSWYLRTADSIDGERLNHSVFLDAVIAKDNDETEFDRIDRLFVHNIYTILEDISSYDDPNDRPENKKKKRKLQIYVMDQYEKYNIENVLYNIMKKQEQGQELTNQVMAILFWIQGEGLFNNPKPESKPSICVEDPVTVITNEISRLYVLPEAIANTLKRAASVFYCSSKKIFNKAQNINNKYADSLTNTVDAMWIHHAWRKKIEDNNNNKMFEDIEAHLKSRLYTEYEIVNKIQQENRNRLIKLSLWPMPYEMLKPKYKDYSMATLDFANQYEELLKRRRTRLARAGGVQNAINSGTILWLEYTGVGDNTEGYTFKILNWDNCAGREWFKVVLCEDTPENRDRIMASRDYFDTTKGVFYAPQNKDKFYYPDDGTEPKVIFKPKVNQENESKFEPDTNKKYLFFEVYADSNSKKTREGISRLRNRKELLNPKELSSSTGVSFKDKSVKKCCEKYWSPDRNNFSPSQKEAFIHLLENRLTILEGPPASGKTDFIARSLITIASYYKSEENKNLKIMVTSMSHSAIDNVLLKLIKMLEQKNPFDIKLYKVKRFDDIQAFKDKDKYVRILLEEDNKQSEKEEVKETVASRMKKREIQIIGMTCWSAYKAFLNNKKNRIRAFDLIVMDEASQIRAMDAFLCLECSNKNTRFLLVGDDNQLPPIVGGKYKEKGNEMFLLGSIFHMFITGLGDKHSAIIKLKDNFRMNGILCKYLANKLYGRCYKPYNDAIKYQEIRLKRSRRKSLMVSLLDPKYPLVFCELTGTVGIQRDAEIKLVTELIQELWERLQNPISKKLASVEGNFWQDNGNLEGACGIISPHHEHIKRIKSSVSKALRRPREEIFIGTVDRLQGKERQVVIVSYGVHDAEKIKNEKEFIFSLNRFNVSLSRGKAKTIVILSSAVCESSLKSNVMIANDSSLQKGIKFVQGFAKYMKSNYKGVDTKTDICSFNGVELHVWKKRLADDKGV